MKNDLLEYIEHKKIFSTNETIVLALSGGVDSMVLFHILNNVNLNLNIVVAHVNHNKRSESINEYDEIKLMANNKRIPFEGLVLNKTLNGNFHDESRKKRFEFFYQIAKKHGASKIVLAHHNDDQLETVLMRIVRGSSFGGYAGIKEITDYKDLQVVRPLLEITKSEILVYASKNSISYFEDKSNNDPIYTRNRFRNEIIPLIKAENKNIRKQTSQFTSYIDMADTFINKQSDKFVKEYFVKGEVDLTAFNKLDDILKIKVLKFTINSKSFDTVEVSFAQYSDMIALLLNDNPNVTYNLSQGFVLVKVYQRFFIEKDTKKQSTSLEINEVGEYIISKDLKYIFSEEELGIIHTGRFELCYNSIVFPLYLRNRKNGDKMSLQVGTKKVKDILIDKKIPSIERENLILVASRDKVLWIPNIKKSLQDNSCMKKIYIYEVR